MNAVTTIDEGVSRELTPIDKLKTNLSSRASEFKQALPAHISFDKFQRTIATAAMSNPDLLTCDRRSLLMAAMKLAQDGLLPDGREAALVKFVERYKGDDGEWYARDLVQPMPMVYGLRKKILQSGQVVSLETGVVYRAEVESGHFIYEIGMDPPIRHRPSLDLTDEQMADDQIVAAYSIARLKNDHGDPYWSVEVMRRSEINKVRQTSQTGAEGRVVKFGKKKGQAIAPKGPWVDWFGEMARKTVLRRHSKVLPMSGDILDALDREDEVFAAEGAGRLLATEEAEHLRLPSDDELDEQSGETIDQDTGEVTTNAAGMTETDEETARALDAGEPDGADEQVEGNDEGEGESLADQKLAEIRASIAAAKNVRGLDAVDGEWVKARAAYDDLTAAHVDAAITARRRELRQPQEAGAQ
jgi:recombination protein RecT